jgi:hypothetical protein
VECGEVFVILNWGQINQRNAVETVNDPPAKKSRGLMSREVKSGEEMYGDT